MKREYKTKQDCAELWVREDFLSVDKDWFVTNPTVEVSFYGLMDAEDGYDEDDAEFEAFGPTHEPMWSTWFIPKNLIDINWVKENELEIALAGFTIIHIESENFSEIALGIDGAGYDFYEARWVPLYELRGFEWHDE